MRDGRCAPALAEEIAASNESSGESECRSALCAGFAGVMTHSTNLWELERAALSNEHVVPAAGGRERRQHLGARWTARIVLYVIRACALAGEGRAHQNIPTAENTVQRTTLELHCHEGTKCCSVILYPTDTPT